MRKAFTLIELLVVLAIIGLLMGLIIPKVMGTLKASREATCKMNLKNLQTACVSHSVDHVSDEGNMPRAGSYELRGTGHYYEHRGWVSWIPKSGAWPKWDRATPGPHKDKMRDAGHVGKDALAGIMMGRLFEYTSKEVGVYSCPVAAHDSRFRALVGAGRSGKVHLSYVMNEFFYCDVARPIWHARTLSWIGTSETTKVGAASVVPDASRLVLFAEYSGVPWTTDSGTIGKNCVLNVPDSQATKPVGGSVPGLGGFHDGPIKLAGSAGGWGLVIFVDGHIEKLPPTARNVGPDGIKNTAWLLIKGRDLLDHLP